MQLHVAKLLSTEENAISISRMFLLLVFQDPNVHYLQVLGNSKKQLCKMCHGFVIPTQKSI